MKKLFAILFFIFLSLNMVACASDETSPESIKKPSSFALLEHKYNRVSVLDKYAKGFELLHKKFGENEQIAQNLVYVPWFNGEKLLWNFNSSRNTTYAVVHNDVDFVSDKFVEIHKNRRFTKVSYWSELGQKDSKPDFIMMAYNNSHNPIYLYDGEKNLLAYSYDENFVIKNSGENSEFSNIIEEFPNVMKNIADIDLAKAQTDYDKVLDILNDNLYKELNYTPENFDFDKNTAISNYYTNARPILNDNSAILKYNRIRSDVFTTYNDSSMRQSWHDSTKGTNELFEYLYKHQDILPLSTINYYKDVLKRNNVVEHSDEILNNTTLSDVDKFFYLFASAIAEDDEVLFNKKVELYKLLKKNSRLVNTMKAKDYNTKMLFILRYASNANVLQKYLKNKNLSNSHKMSMFLAEEISSKYNSNEKVKNSINYLGENGLLVNGNLENVVKLEDSKYPENAVMLIVELSKYGYYDICLNNLSFFDHISYKRFMEKVSASNMKTKEAKVQAVLNQYIIDILQSYGVRLAGDFQNKFLNDKYYLQYGLIDITGYYYLEDDYEVNNIMILLDSLRGKFSDDNIRFLYSEAYNKEHITRQNFAKNEDGRDNIIPEIRLVVNNKKLSEDEKVLRIYNIIFGNFVSFSPKPDVDYVNELDDEYYILYFDPENIKKVDKSILKELKNTDGFKTSDICKIGALLESNKTINNDDIKTALSIVVQNPAIEVADRPIFLYTLMFKRDALKAYYSNEEVYESSRDKYGKDVLLMNISPSYYSYYPSKFIISYSPKEGIEAYKRYSSNKICNGDSMYEILNSKSGKFKDYKGFVQKTKDVCFWVVLGVTSPIWFPIMMISLRHYHI